MSEIPRPERLVREREVLEKYFPYKSRSRLDEKISRGEFPAPIKLTDSGRAKAWLESELIEYQQKRIAARDAAARRKRDAPIKRAAGR